MISRSVPQNNRSQVEFDREFALTTMYCSEIKENDEGLYYFEIGDEEDFKNE